jgi:hypothetical protein
LRSKTSIWALSSAIWTFFLPPVFEEVHAATVAAGAFLCNRCRIFAKK